MLGHFTLVVVCLLFEMTKQENVTKISYNYPKKAIGRTEEYLYVPNLSNIDLGIVFLPLPAVTQPRPTTSRPPTTTVPIQSFLPWYATTTEAPIKQPPVSINPDSSIGYDVPCGIRGTDYWNGNRIVGGSNAEPGEFPWQVSLQLLSGWSARHICGGSVVSKHWIVTAAHCVAGLAPASLSVVAGDYDLYRAEGHEQRVGVLRIVMRGYKRGNFSNDIALLQVDPPLRMDGIWIAPLCIPKPYHDFPSGYGTVTGWGRLAENGELPHILQRVTIPLIDKGRCRQLYSNAGYSKYLNDCQLCSGWEQGGLDSCQGDSGGPMACRRPDGYYYLCGVVSWGVGCARPRFPGVYTEINCYSNWIHDILYARTSQQILANSDSG